MCWSTLVALQTRERVAKLSFQTPSSQYSMFPFQFPPISKIGLVCLRVLLGSGIAVKSKREREKETQRDRAERERKSR